MASVFPDRKYRKNEGLVRDFSKVHAPGCRRPRDTNQQDHPAAANDFFLGSEGGCPACAGPDGNGMAGQWGLMGVGYRAWLGLVGVG